MTTIGRLDKRVVIERDDSNPLNSGGVNPWADPVEHASAWARIEKASAADERLSDGILPTMLAAYRVTIRYVAGVTELMRVKWGSRYFAIRHAPASNRHDRFLVLDCEEVE